MQIDPCANIKWEDWFNKFKLDNDRFPTDEKKDRVLKLSEKETPIFSVKEVEIPEEK